MSNNQQDAIGAFGFDHDCATVGIDHCRACRLSALAPEMAEAILALVDHSDRQGFPDITYEQHDAFETLADRLRALSRDTEEATR